jgi:hypothetical protein
MVVSSADWRKIGRTTRDTPRVFILPLRDVIPSLLIAGSKTPHPSTASLERSILDFRLVAVAFARERLSLLHALGPALDLTKTSGNLTRTQKRVNRTSGLTASTISGFRPVIRPYGTRYVPTPLLDEVRSQTT